MDILHPAAVIGTNAWGSEAYGKLVRGSYVDETTIRESMELAKKKGLLIFDLAQDYGFGRAQKMICGCRKPYQVEQLYEAANVKLSDKEIRALEEEADRLDVKILGADIFRFAVRKKKDGQ